MEDEHGTGAPTRRKQTVWRKAGERPIAPAASIHSKTKPGFVDDDIYADEDPIQDDVVSSTFH